MYYFGQTSLKRRAGIHPDLIAVDDRALAYGIIDMMYLRDGGVRTEARQMELVAAGASRTMNSRHLVQADGYGHARDTAPYPIDWNDIDAFIIQAQCVRFAANDLGVRLIWGAVWDRYLNDLGPDLHAEVDAYVARRRAMGRKVFLDYPHFQYEGRL